MAKKDTNVTPAWVEELQRKYQSGVAHGFILHFNTNDYAVPGTRMRAYLAKMMASRKVVVFYNRSDGIQFALPSMREEFIERLGLKAQASNPAVAALAAVQGLSQQEQELPKSPSAALPLLVKLLKMGAPSDKLAAVIIEHAQTIVPDAALGMMSAEDRNLLVLIEQLGRDPEIEASGNPVILLTPNLTDLHQSIRAASSKYEAIRIPLPDRETRLVAIKAYREKRPETEWDLSTEQLANATAGLSLVHLEDIFLRAEQNKRLTQALVRERKATIIANEFEVLEVVEPRFGFEMIGGLEHVKKAFRRCVIDPIQAGKRKLVPMGILMTGPAGTGKTAVAEAVAFETGFNCVNLNLSRIFNKYVGDTEKNIDRAFYAILAMEPITVFIDEIDQSVSRANSGDAGTSSRVFRRLLEFMSDTSHRGRVIFLAATNRPDLMDAALRRPGRFDKKIPFLLPENQEREAFFLVMSRRYDLGLSTVPQKCITGTENWTGAEIEAATVKALEVVEYDGKSPEEAITYAIENMRPSTADTEFMTAIALQECSERDLLPEKYWPLFDDKKALKQRIQETAPVERGKRGDL